MIKKLLIPIFSIFILMGQMPPNIIIDENENYQLRMDSL